MAKKKEIKRIKILSYYLISIVLPCIILGFFAFRGLKNDQALLERERLNTLKMQGTNVIDSLETSLLSIETDFNIIADTLPVPRECFIKQLSIAKFIENNEFVKGVFFRKVPGEMCVVDNGLLYRKSGNSLNPSLMLSESFTNYIQNG